MSVVAALTLVLLVGFMATALVAFFVWRQRMRESSGLRIYEPRTLSASTRTGKVKQYDGDGDHR